MVVGGQRHALAALRRERPGIHSTGGWMGARASEIVFRDIPIKYDSAVNAKHRRFRLPV